MTSSSSPWPFGEPHGCDGDGCASNPDAWPLHHAYRSGERCRLCSSCILLSDRSVYCCCCFLLITSPSFHYDDDDPLMAPPGPTVTCQVCCSAVAHLACLYELHPAGADYGVFVCPACSAAEEGRPFTYAPPCRQPLDARAARVLLLGARMAMALLQREAAAARAKAERLARDAGEARRRAYRALGEALGVDAQEAAWYSDADQPPAVPTQGPEDNRPAAPPLNIVDAPQPHEDHLAASEEGSQAMPPLAGLTIGTGCATAVVAAMAAPAESSHTPPLSSWSLPAFGAGASSRTCPPSPRTLDLFGVREMAIAAAEAARANPPPAPRTLQLFPADKASASPKVPRTLQLFEDKIPDDDEEM